MDVMYDDKPLKDDLTFIDIAYIFAWRAKVMRVFFSLTNNSPPPFFDLVGANEVIL